MPTRFYLPSSGSAAVSPTYDSGWEDTTQASRLRLVYKQAPTIPVTTMTSALCVVPVTTTQDLLTRQFVSDPLSYPINFGDTLFSAVVRCYEVNATANCYLSYVLYLVSQDGTTNRGTLASSFAVTTEMGTSATTRIFSNIGLVSLTSQSGDRIVFEMGVHAQAPSTGEAIQLRIGTAATSDFALTANLTTDLNPWIEFSSNLFTPDSNNYQFVKVGDGMSVSEKIR